MLLGIMNVKLNIESGHLSSYLVIVDVFVLALVLVSLMCVCFVLSPIIPLFVLVFC